MRGSSRGPAAAFFTALEAGRAFVRERPRLAVGVAAGVVLLLAVLVVAKVAAKSVLEGRARALGLEARANAASLGFGSVTFRDVAIESRELPSVRATLARVTVYPGLTLRPRRVEVEGGALRLNGSSDELSNQLDAWRKAHRGGGDTGDEPASVLPLDVHGIDVTWRGDGDALDAWGFRYSRDAEGRERIGVDLARGSHGKSRLEAKALSLAFLREGRARVVNETSAERLAFVFDLDAREVASGSNRAPSVAPVVAPVEDDDDDRGPRLRARLAGAVAKLSKGLPSGRPLELSGVHFELRRGGQSLNLGPATVVVEKQPVTLRLSVSSGQGEGRDPLKFEVVAPLVEGPVDVSLSGGPLPLSALGVNEGDMGLASVGSSELDVSGSARLSADGRDLSLRGDGRLTNLSIHQPRLARNPVRGLSLSLSGSAQLALDGSLTTLENVEVGLGKARAKVSGKIARADGHAAGDFHVEAPLSACSDVLSATPSALVPLLNGLTVTGTFTFSGNLSFDTRRPADAKVAFTGSNDCEVTQVPPSLSLERFRRPWTRTVKGADGLPTTIESGPGTTGWVPYGSISPYMATAVVICEDARFFSHRGFDAQSIQSSIKDNLREGRFVRGGSTVTMQLAKNLFLEREKTLSRKLQEAVLTLLLEQSLRKEEILELYLNVVEFGPGIYGIGPAAAHYFRSRPRDLSLGQSLYLASILPNPKIHHFAEGGLLKPAWAEYLRKLMKIAHKIHRIDDRELEIGLEETVQLGVASTADAFLRGDDSDLRDEAPDRDGP